MLFLSLLFSFPAWANYSKPELLARYSGNDAFNAQDDLYCFSSEPEANSEGVFLGCQSQQGYMMVHWGPHFEVVAATENGIFSHPKSVAGNVSWYEFDEAGVKALYEFRDQSVQVTPLKNLGPISALIDSFIALKNETYLYRLQEESKKLLIWKNHEISTLYSENVSHIFPPVSSANGNFLMKIRRNDLSESSPDELLLWNGEFKNILKDRDADGKARFISFRHQYALDGEKIALIGTDDQGEALYLIDQNHMIEVARVGRDLAGFDYFSPKLKNGVLAFRGMDLENRRTLWVYESGKLTKLLTRGDVVQTDKGAARFDYSSQDALFYGAPGIGPTGEIYLQATLTAIDTSMTLLGIGLIKFHKE